jgi:hypothetical protein
MANGIHRAAIAVLFAMSTGTAAGAQSTLPSQRGAIAVAGEASVTRDLATLSPEFRLRFERVLSRLERELGTRVEIVETWRSQTRQDLLYEQGRTRPGPVVTWTRSSAHLGGRAADVVIPGARAGGRAYARLAAIARSEGLRTLGARDPGHVELPGAAVRAYAASPRRTADPLPGSTRALARIVPSSRGAKAPSTPTVFAASPYVGIMSPSVGTFTAAGRVESPR